MFGQVRERILRLAFNTGLGFVALAACGLSQAAAPASAPLPQAMLGVWAPNANACTNTSNDMRDGRITLTQEGVTYFASHWHVRVWQRYRDIFRGRAAVQEEGEAKPLPGISLIGLRLLKDGKLEVQRFASDLSLYVKCADTKLP